jgi:hypothetical protein
VTLLGRERSTVEFSAFTDERQVPLLRLAIAPCGSRSANEHLSWRRRLIRQIPRAEIGRNDVDARDRLDVTGLVAAPGEGGKPDP